MLLFILNIPVILILLFNKNSVATTYTTSAMSQSLFYLTFGNIGEGLPVCGTAERKSLGNSKYE